jgi:hypothetical protein
MKENLGFRQIRVAALRTNKRKEIKNTKGTEESDTFGGVGVG